MESMIESIKQDGEQEIYALFDSVSLNLANMPKLEAVAKEIELKKQKTYSAKNHTELDAINTEIESLSREKIGLENSLTNDNERWAYDKVFYKKIRPDQAADFKEYILRQLNLLKTGLGLAKDKFYKNPDFAEYLELRNQHDKMVSHLDNELEYDTDEYKKQEEIIDQFEASMETFFAGLSTEIKQSYEQLSSDYYAKSKTYKEFEYLARKKIKVIEQVLIPVAEQQKKYADLRHKYQTGFYDTEMNRLYEELDKDPENKSIEQQITDIERQIRLKSQILNTEEERLDRMKYQISGYAHQVLNSIF